MRILIFSLLLALSSCEPGCSAMESVAVVGDSLPYNFHVPSQMISFPSDDLKEISGLSPTDKPGIFAAISDEKGVAYLLDATQNGAITTTIPFREKGDFEALEMVGQTLYCMKSNGDLFALKNWKSDGTGVEQTETKIGLKKSDNIEGLCYDSKRKALLVACKGNADSLAARPIYAFDLQTLKLSPTPIYSIDPAEVDKGLGNTEKGDKKRFFATSGIAIDPISGDCFVISSVGKRLLVLDYATGKIKSMVQLDKKILPQPEGIAFDPAGNLYLSSEGKKGESALLRFDRKK